MKWIAALLSLCLLAGCITGCVAAESRTGAVINSYTDIPGITQEEISAVEALKAERDRFSYGHLIVTESFIQEDGTFAGFTIGLCELLSSLFGIEFTPKPYEEWDALKNDIDTSALDFSGEFAQTAELMREYYMSAPISGRSLSAYSLEGLYDIETESDINGMKAGFLAGTLTNQLIAARYPEIYYDYTEVPGLAEAAQMLKNGEIDVFIADSAADTIFLEYGQIQSHQLFQFVYSSAAITTKNPELQPIISVINKYLASDGMERIFELYEEENKKYKGFRLKQSFTGEESRYLDDLKANGAKVDIGIQHDVYPVSFYNEMDNKFEGIALNILSEITELTGIEFETITTSTQTPLSEILEKLKNGEISMMTQLLYLDSRKNDYIWSARPYHTTNYALLSKAEYPDLEPFQVYHSRVGTIAKSAHEEMFCEWFPEHEKTIPYKSGDAAFDALENDEVDLVMMSENMLLAQTNYREKPGYKINMSFNKTLNSTFGYNKQETVLRDIVDKALMYVDIEGINKHWMLRTFDYEKKISQMQTLYVSIFTVAVLIVLCVILYMFMGNKRLGKSLLERTASLTAIYEAIPDIVFSMDTGLIYTSCNPGFEKFAGKPKDEIIGKTDREVFGDSEAIDFFTGINKKVLENRHIEVVKERITYPDGEQKFMETIKTPLFQHGRLTGLMGISRDITEISDAVEEAREASKTKSLFLANMSHEIRTPMNAIIGMSELLLSEPLTERQQGYVRDISVSSHSLLAIINDILDLSKIEAGKLELNPTDYNFHMFLDNIRSMFEFIARNKGLDFQYEEVGETPQCLFGDDIRLRQVLTNICGNAVKFTKAGFIRMSLTVRDETITFAVADSGIGMREEEIPKLFNAFAQADTRKNRSITGTGLGLSISKSFIEMMGGNISVSSVYGEGTVFTFTIPKILGNASALGSEKDEKRYKNFIAPDARVLVVDDNELNLKVAAGLFSLLKINAETVSSGREAIEAVQRTDYDMVFMDHMMPEMDGIEATREIRSLGESFERLIIVALTANAVTGAKEMFMANGFDGFISKPIEMSEMEDILVNKLPPEKIIRSSEALPEYGDGARDDFMESLESIECINTEIGLSHVSGVVSMYRETLELLSKKLCPEADRMESFLNAGELRGLAISVHGMKSSLATIGALKLSEAAFALEKAAKGEDSAFCTEQLPAFLSELRTLQEQLSLLFVAEDTAPRPEGDAGFLQENARAAHTAVLDFDGDLAAELIGKLREYSFGQETDDILEDVKSAIDDFDFEAAADALNKIHRE